MITDVHSIKGDFIPDYQGWENDFDELCRRLNHITVKLHSPDLAAGIQNEIQERAAKNGFRPIVNPAGKQPEIFAFTKSAP